MVSFSAGKNAASKIKLFLAASKIKKNYFCKEVVTEMTKAQLNPQMDVMTWDLTSNLHIDFRVHPLWNQKSQSK